MFGDIKIDKFRLMFKTNSVNPDFINMAETELTSLFHSVPIFRKLGNTYYSITPTKLIRNPKANHNLQQPRQKNLLRAINRFTFADSNFQNQIKSTELHLTKDLLLEQNTGDFLDMIANLKLPQLVPIHYSSDKTCKSIYFAPPKRTVDNEEYTGNFIIKFYDKIAEYLAHHDNNPIVQLNEHLGKQECEIVGDVYNIAENTLNISELNILRIEIVYKTTNILKPIIAELRTDDETTELALSLIIKHLEMGTLYDGLEKVFNNTLKKYIFTERNKAKKLTYNMDRIRSMAIDYLAHSSDFYHYKAVFADLDLKSQFSQLHKMVRKIKPESELYDKLYDKLFNPSKTMTSIILVGAKFKKPCKAYSLVILKVFILVYDVPIFDDS